MKLNEEEQIILDAIKAARKIQTFLWGMAKGSWGLEEWRRMFRKRIKKIDDINIENPYAIIELRKRLLQNATLSIALLHILQHYKLSEHSDLPSNLPEYMKNA